MTDGPKGRDGQTAVRRAPDPGPSGAYGRIIGLVERAWDALAAVVYAVIVLLMAAMVTVTAAQVFYRYVLNQPLTWSEELSRYLFIWIVFLAAWAGFRQGLHLGVNAVSERLPPIGVAIMARVIEAIILVFLLAALSAADQVLTITARQTSATLRLPMHAIYAAFPVAAVLMIGEILLGWLQPRRRSPGQAQVETGARTL